MKLRRWPIHCAVVAVLAGMDTAPLRAQGSPESLGITEPSIATSLPQNGDPFGIRKRLYDHHFFMFLGERSYRQQTSLVLAMKKSARQDCTRAC